MERRLRLAIVSAEASTALSEGLVATIEAMRRGEGAVRAIDGLGEGASAARFEGERPESAAAGPGGRVVTPHGAVLDRVAAAVHVAARGAALPRESIGLYVAMGMIDSAPADLLPAIAASRGDDGGFDAGRFLEDGFRSLHPLWPLAMLPNVVVGQMAADLDVRGDHLVTGPEADAGVTAVSAAAEAVRDGVVRAAITAGVSETVGAGSLARARLRGTQATPLGEGGAALWIEREDEAIARGLAPLARLSGWATAFSPGAEAGTSSDALVRVAREALSAAGLSPDDVGLVVVDGTGVADAGARRELFGERRAKVATVAPAVALGHLLGAAPVFGAALAAASLARDEAPSTAAGRPRPLHGARAALVLATGSAGGAGALVVERAS